MLIRQISIAIVSTFVFFGPTDSANSADGRYITACKSVAWENCDGRLEVVGLEFRFWESVCLMTNPVQVRDMPDTVLYDAVCEGEGDKWTERHLIQTGNPIGITILNKSGALFFRRCINADCL